MLEDDQQDGQQRESTIVLPGITSRELSTVLRLVYHGQAPLGGESGKRGDVARYRDCLKLVSSLGIPIEELVVETKLKAFVDSPPPPQGKHQSNADPTAAAATSAAAAPAGPAKKSVLTPPFLVTTAGPSKATASVVSTCSNGQKSFKRDDEDVVVLGSKCSTAATGTGQSTAATTEANSPSSRRFFASASSSPSTPSSVSPSFSTDGYVDNVEAAEERGSALTDGGDNIMYKCDLCEGRFPLMEFLKHQEAHRDDLPYSCPSPACGSLKFKTQSELKTHRRINHKTTTTTTARSPGGSLHGSKIATTNTCLHCNQVRPFP